MFSSIPGASAQTRLRLAHFSPIEDPNHDAAVAFSQAIKQSTDGRFDFQIFENNKLGGEVEILEAIALGAVDVAPPSAAVLANVIPELNILNMPFLFRDWDHYAAVLNGPFFDAISGLAAAKGIRILGFMTSGPRQLMSTSPVASIDDLKGRKIRSIQNPVHIATFSAFGANPTAIAYPEVYGALQTGVVDGGDAANTNYHGQRFYEVAPHWAVLDWLYFTNPLIMSESKFQELSAEDQERFLKIGRETGIAQISGWRKSDEELLSKFESLGVTISRPDRAPFMDAVGPVYEEFLRSDFEKDWLEKIRKL